VATQAGTYVATGTTLDYDPCIGVSGACSAPVEVPPPTTRDIADFNPTACSPPTISSILVDSGNGPQPISQLPIGSSGTIAILGACLDSTTQISIGFDPSSDYAGSSTGVIITGNGTGTPTGWGEINAQYSVASGTMPETVLLTVSTSSGSASANMDVVTSGPYIESINPVEWPPNTSSTIVTISGSGFGANGGSLNVAAPQGDVSLVSIQTWTDNAIIMNVYTGPNSAGENVTITLTGGADFGFATGFQNTSTSATGQNASAPAYVSNNPGCTDPALGQLISEYATFMSDLHPTCSSFIPLTWVGNPGWQVKGFITLPVGSQTVPIQDLNWSWYMNWAIVLPTLTPGLNSILANTPFPLIIDSAYRNPAKEYTYTKGTRNPLVNAGTSRHVHGDAVDLGTHNTDAAWTQMYNAVKSTFSQSENYCVEPRDQSMAAVGGSSSWSSNNHLHIDWRAMDTPPRACPTGWNP